jgi:hypothetical protein
MPLHISDRRERALVATADRALAGLAAIAKPFRRRQRTRTPKRILVLRLERIGDLLMTLPALADLRAFAPAAEIDLVVGSWNADLARAIDPVTRVVRLDAAWLAREAEGRGVLSLIAAARRLRDTDYDLAVNFEPDIRGNVVLAASGARWIAGYRSGGGGPLLDLALDFDTASHSSDNARRLVSAIFDPGRTTSDAGRAVRGPRKRVAVISRRGTAVDRNPRERWPFDQAMAGRALCRGWAPTRRTCGRDDPVDWC